MAGKRSPGVASIAICDRCGFKFKYNELRRDQQNPGLRVCKDDFDHKDPYRLPAIKTESLTPRFPRPDVPLQAPGEPPNSQV